MNNILKKNTEKYVSEIINHKSYFVNRGFTIIEMLIVLLVFGILTILVTQSLAQSLRGTKKSLNVGRVRENVEYAMASMDRLLHNAQSIITCANPTLNYVDEFGNNAVFSCLADSTNCGSSSNDGYIASGSGNLRLTSQKVCIDCDNATPIFSCTLGSPGVPPSVTISITAADAALGSQPEGAQITSKTRVLLRNY